MKFGLLEQDLSFITNSLTRYREIEKAVVFGSRAKGNYKPGSDVDLAIMGEDISFDTVARLHSLLEELSPMPYFFDVVDYTHLEQRKLKEHIDRLISDGHLWIDALEKRNLMAHTDDEKKADEAERLIRDQYFKMMTELYDKLTESL